MSTKLTIQKGVPYLRTLQFNDMSTGAAVAYDLTDKTVFFTVKNMDDNADDDTTAVIKKDITVHTDPEAGTTTLSLDGTETDVPAGDYKFDFKIYLDDPLIDLNSRKGICEIIDKVTERIS